MSENMLIPLASLPEDQMVLEVSDVDGLTMAYRRILDPIDKVTPYFSVHYKDGSTADEWNTINGLLSSGYTVARTEAIMDHIVSNLNAERIGYQYRRENTYVKLMFIVKGFELPADELTVADFILFKLLTNIDVESLNSKRTLAFCIINGFDGKFALTLNYGLVSTLFSGNETSPTHILRVTNQFVLDEFSRRLVHASDLSVNFTQIEDVKKIVNSKIAHLKSINVNAQFLDGMKKITPKKFQVAFFTVYDSLPDEFKNLYYVTYIWSRLCEGTTDIYREITLRRYLSVFLIARQKVLDSDK